MQNYSFENLNDKEFEVLVNDLLSKREGLDVDRFKPGRDGGVDGRFFMAGSQEVIIQSKHWLKTGIKPLIARLKKDEAEKVKKINPKRYILATSLNLSLSDKKQIKTIFEPFIISDDDIIGQENLNFLLGKNDDIERKHYKLWLSSSSVIRSMQNAAIIGRSDAKLDEIIEATKMYVVTNNHLRALKKLEELRSVVITGEAGIGKTTLADQLAQHYVAHDFELCVIENDISEAENNYVKNKKQVFYFDDFLGRNFLLAIEGRKDNHVLDFMKRVGNDKSKRFILTSRSTVLKQGKLHSDLLGIKKIDKKEYEMTIQSLSTFDRASILYNHIWHGSLEEQYIEALYADKRYAKIAKHPNFNPRIISFITDPDRFEGVRPEQYWEYIIDKLDNPKDIWSNVFDNQIDELTRLAVCIIVFNGASMSEEDFKTSLFERAMADGLITASSAPNKYTSMLKVAVGSLLRRTISDSFDNTKLDLFNPSVADFVLGRFLDDALSQSEYFSCLNTTYSLTNLKSLKDNKSLTDGVYFEILKKLAARKINADFFKSNPQYFLSLSHLIVADAKVLSECYITEILENIETIDKSEIPDGYIGKTCDILEFALLSKPKVFQKVACDFIIRSTKESLMHHDLVVLENLRNSIPSLSYAVGKNLKSAIQSEIIAYWEDEVHQEIVNDNCPSSYDLGQVV